MGRRTRLILFLFTLGAASGALLMPRAAHAMPLGPDGAQAVATAAAPTTPDQVTVAAGDYLSTIAPRVQRTWEQLAGWNHLADPDHIMPGEVLNIPPAGYTPPSYANPPPDFRAPVAKSFANSSRFANHESRSAIPVVSGGWSQPWACIAEGVPGGARYGTGESGGNPYLDTGNGYEGGLQFSPSTWTANAPLVGVHVAHAYQASIGQQEAVAAYVLAHSSWQSQWPNTSKACDYW